MGIGFVLIVWAVLLAVLAVPAVLVLLWAARRTGGRARAERVLRWVAVAGPLAAGYAGAGFVAYALWCGEVRGVDPGVGDSWTVPLGAGFRLDFIDTRDEAFIPARREVGGADLLDGITEVGQAGPYVFGLQAPDSAFVLDTRSGTLRRPAPGDLPAALRAAGIAGAAAGALAPAGEFYASRRWGWPDVAAAVLLVGPVLLFGGRSARRAWAGGAARVA